MKKRPDEEDPVGSQPWVILGECLATKDLESLFAKGFSRFPPQKPMGKPTPTFEDVAQIVQPLRRPVGVAPHFPTRRTRMFGVGYDAGGLDALAAAAVDGSDGVEEPIAATQEVQGGAPEPVGTCSTDYSARYLGPAHASG